MKKILLACFTLLYCLNSIHADDKGYTITVNIKNCQDSVLYLVNYYGSQTYLRDTAYAMPGGKYIFHKTDKTLQRGMYVLASQKKAKYMEFFIDKEQNFTINTDTLEMLRHAEVKGSKQNDNFLKYVVQLADKQKQLRELGKKKVADSTDAYDEEIKALQKDINKTTDTYIQKNPGTLSAKCLWLNEEIDIPEAPKNEDGTIDSTFQARYYKDHFWDHMDWNDDAILYSPFFHTRLERYFERIFYYSTNDTITNAAVRLIESVADKYEYFKYIVWWAVGHYEVSKVMGQEEVFVNLARRYYIAGRCDWASETLVNNIQKRIDQLEPLLIGKTAPEIVMPDTNGTWISSYLTRGPRYTIYWFYDPDCGHCKTQTPKLMDFLKENRDSLGIEVYAIAMDNNRKQWVNFINKYHMECINVGGLTANMDYKTYFDIIGTPVLYLMDKDMKIIGKKIEPTDLKGFILSHEKSERAKVEEEKTNQK